MTGHAFQELVADDVVHVSLTAIRDALADGGRFVFETRDPRDRPWERWEGALAGQEGLYPWVKA